MRRVHAISTCKHVSLPGSAHYGGDQDLGLVRFGAVVAEVQPDVPVVAPRVNIRMRSATLVAVWRILVIKEDELLLNAHAQYLLTFAGEPLEIKRFVDRQQNLSARMSILSKLYKFQLIKVLKVLKRLHVGIPAVDHYINRHNLIFRATLRIKIDKYISKKWLGDYWSDNTYD